MAVELGIVGLPNVGKSTLFNALTKAHALVANYPFTTIEPNVGVVAVPDERLGQIAAIVRPEKVTPSSMRLVDIAGLVKGASSGEGLGNQFLGHIRNVDAVAMLIRTFRDPDVPHVTPELDPVADVATVNLELILADLATVDRALATARDASKGKPVERGASTAPLDSLLAHLNSGLAARMLSRTSDEWVAASALNLLTAKPVLYVANVGEADLPDGGEMVGLLRHHLEPEGAELLIICAQCESELADWPPADAQAYLQELGLSELGVHRFVRAGYQLLNLITFFTSTGGKEVRAWPLARGTTVLEAAGSIHSDMERGFIRAEVVSYQDLTRTGSLAAARDSGLLRIEGRDYVVQDGDVIHIRFNV